MNIAERIYETVKALSEQSVCEVFDFAENLKSKQVEDEHLRRENALATMAKFKADKFNLEDCYDFRLNA